MLYFNNPKRSRKSRKRSSVRRKSRRRSSRHRVARSSTSEVRMARRRSRRRARVGARRHRRRSTMFAANPGHRRRSRRYRRNPGIGGGGGIVSTLKSGVKDGVVVLAAQIATRRVINLVAGFNPLKGLPGTAVNGLGTAVLVTIAARKMVPNLARLASAAAFAEALRGIGAGLPVVGPFLAGYSDGSDGAFGAIDDGYGAWPQIPATTMAAYPTAFAGEEEYQQ